MPDHAETYIVVVEDDASVRDAVVDYLHRHGFAADGAEDAQALDRMCRDRRPDLVILDIMLPGESGLDVCRRLKDGPPVLILSALDDAGDRVAGLELGAADYLGKPFDPRELVARVRAVLRRNAQPTPAAPQRFTFAGWIFEPDASLLHTPAGQRLTLTAGELRLLQAFVRNPKRLLSRERLFDLTHGDSAECFDRSIDLAVSRLRRRLRGPAEHPDLIETVRGMGYRFSADVEQQ